MRRNHMGLPLVSFLSSTPGRKTATNLTDGSSHSEHEDKNEVMR